MKTIMRMMRHATPLALGMGLYCGTAGAQMEYMAEAMRPEYLTRDLVVFAEGLNLDETQEVIVEAMFETYDDDFQTGWAATTERLNAIADEIRSQGLAQGQDPQRALLEPVLSALGDWLDEKRQLDEGMLDNVNAILLPEQRALWPAFTQRLYREKHMHRGRLSGESVDLYQILRDTDVPSAIELDLDPYLNEYAAALDAAMRRRDAILRGNPRKLFDRILEGQDQQDTAMVEQVIAARVEVREVNDRYIDVIANVLPTQWSDDFRQRALARGYPRIYRRTPAQRIIRQAVENELYPPDLHVQIIQLEGAYLGELGFLNDKLLRMTREHEPAVQRSREEASAVRRGGGIPTKLEDPTREVYKDREEVGRRYIDMLRALLSEEQFQELDGSQRWYPRGERPTGPRSKDPAVGPDGGLSLTDPDAPNRGLPIGKDGQPIKPRGENQPSGPSGLGSSPR